MWTFMENIVFIVVNWKDKIRRFDERFIILLNMLILKLLNLQPRIISDYQRGPTSTTYEIVDLDEEKISGNLYSQE